MRGRLRLTVNVDVLDPAEAPCGGGSAESTIEVDVDLDQTLDVVAIPVGYNGPDWNAPGTDATTTIAAPTLTDFTNRLGYTLKIFPINENPVVRLTAPLTIDFTLDGDRLGDGGCSQAWYTFLAFTLLPAKILDGSVPNSVYVGLLPSALPKNPTGCATFGVTGLSVTASRTIAHEIGHILGRPHAPRGPVGNSDPAYPAYEPYDQPDTPNGSLGEYGVDVVAETIFPPGGADLMSYGSNRWISLHNYNKLIQPGGGWLTPTPVAAGASGDRDHDPGPEPCIALTALARTGDEIEVGHVARVDAHRNHRRYHPGAQPTGHVVELVDARGTVLASSALHAEEPIGCGCAQCAGRSPRNDHSGGDSGHGDTHGSRFVAGLALLPDRARGAELRIRSGEKILWARKAPPRLPRLRLREAKISGRRVRLAWDAVVHGEQPAELSVRWSTDRRTWRVLSPSLTGNRATLDARALPPGRVYLELLLHDGFHTTKVASRALTVPERGPDLALLNPINGEPVRAGGRLRLWATARTARGAVLPDDQISWRLDGKRIGRGRSVWIEAPRPGTYTLTCTGTDGRRRTTERVNLVTE